MTVLHRQNISNNWTPCEIICAMPWGQFLCREVGREFPGVFAAYFYDLRETGSTLVFHKPGRRET